MRILLLVVASIVALTPALTAAQVMPTRVIRRGGLAFDLSDGEPISYFLEHSRELELTEQQRTSLIEVRRRLRQTNAPFYRQLDSLRELVGLSLEPRPRVTEQDMAALEKFQKLSKPVVDSMRVNNQAAQGEARLLLREVQRAKLDSLIVSERDTTRGRGRRPPRQPSR